MIFGMARGFCSDFLPQINTDLFSQINTDKLKDDSCVLQLCFLFLVYCCFSQIGAEFFADDRKSDLCVLRVLCGEKTNPPQSAQRAQRIAQRCCNCFKNHRLSAFFICVDQREINI